MTGNEVLNKALILLGYTDSMGETSGGQRIDSRSLVVLNAIYSDLFYIHNESGFEPLNTVNDKIKLSERILNDIMPYGVAAMLAQSESDGDNQQLFMSLYNQKRASITQKETIQDVLPRV